MQTSQEKIGEVMTYGGSAGTVVAGLSLSDIGVFVGIATALVGVGVQIYFGRRRDKRERDIHAAMLKNIGEKKNA